MLVTTNNLFHVIRANNNTIMTKLRILTEERLREELHKLSLFIEQKV